MAKRPSKSPPPNRNVPDKAASARPPAVTIPDTPPEPSTPADIEIVETTAVADPALDDTSSGAQRAERVPILGEAHGEVTVFQPVIIKEISRTGANVQTAFPLHL